MKAQNYGIVYFCPKKIFLIQDVQKPSIPKGTRDFGPQEAIRRQYIIDTIRKNFHTYGFMPIETPTLENLSVLTGKYGDEGDQLLFKVLNSGDFLKKSAAEDFEKGSNHLQTKIAEKGLRYDLTVPFARYVVMNQNNITYPFRRYQIQPVWRADRPQKGRYREFYQCDADIIGSDSLLNEVELTLLLHDVFGDLGISEFELLINHRDILYGLAEYVGLKGQEIPFCVIIDKLDKIGAAQVEKELLDLNANDQVPELMRIIGSDGNNSEKLELIERILSKNQGSTYLSSYFEHLKSIDHRKLNIQFSLGLARGLTYYTGMIFEVQVKNVEIGSVLGGGRYDNLTGVFGLQGISGVGISFGLDRIYDVMNHLNLFPEKAQSTTRVLLCHLDNDSRLHAFTLVDQLRKKDIPAEIFPDQVKLKKQLNYANKLEIPYTIIIGSDEINEGIYTLKDMRTGEQSSLALDDLVNNLNASS